MKTTAVCALALAGIFAVGFCGGVGAVPYKPTDCHMVPGKCVTKTTVCPPPGSQPQKKAPSPGGQGQAPTPCVPKTYQSCAPAKKVCD
jgi:hypothetical protein